MRVRVIDVEGHPDELRQLPELMDLLGQNQGAPSYGQVEADPDGGNVWSEDGETLLLDAELADFISTRAGSVARNERVQRWVVDVLDWGTTEWEFGRSKNTSDGLNSYLMLYVKGPRRFGAFAYVMPGQAKVMLRLEARDAEGYEHAAVRNVKPGTGYVVTVTLNSDEAHAEALELAKKALGRVED